MKCHYVNDKKAGRVLIPVCMSVVHTLDIKNCTCPSVEKSMEERVSKLEREIKRLNQILKENKY